MLEVILRNRFHTVLSEAIHEYWQAALAASGKSTRRHRNFPAEAVVYFVVAMALYMYMNLREVLFCLMAGSGKTSGSGQILAMAFVQAEFGRAGAVRQAGRGALREHYARQTGRSESLIVFNNSRGRRFNFL